MHGKESIPAQKLKGLVVQSLDRQTVIKLPKAYSRESIPARGNQIPTPEIASKWRHLTKIKDEIPPVQHDVEVGLLIGCNCPKALKPQEVILGIDNNPYAVRTKLGWGIIGPEDLKFLEIVKQGNSLQDGHYEMPLPIKDRNVLLPNNGAMAWKRLKPLKKRLDSSKTYHQHYLDFMNKVMDNGYAERLPEQELRDTGQPVHLLHSSPLCLPP
ncbi:hypothetical protein AWC38_SpisGene21017 [Stylophora pistillata]|uniref:Peptidase aspartic putative domain-containing protein n=1 Tax=Stylophora pistillata TaxID=50429 RepID=A0A2B4REW2_STYPI|nr:hypothetical protein AWC38_SpisGene21017 [Stylophora pistillata]